jgi:hypothetical protein
MMLDLVNFNLNVNWQAEAVRAALAGLHESYLKDKISDTLSIETNQFLNGRERGYCLQVYDIHNPKKNLYIFFAEHRRSDELFVQHVEADWRMNGPRLEDFTSESYETRLTLPSGSIFEAARHIQDLIEKFDAETGND